MLRSALAFLAAMLVFATQPASAQVQRVFPQNALRGALVVGEAPEILLNGKPARLAPGARIRDAGNLSVVPGAILGARLLVHYTLDLSGLVKEVWILRPEEAAVRPWPTTPDEAAAWSFDAANQVWTKP